MARRVELRRCVPKDEVKVSSFPEKNNCMRKIFRSPRRAKENPRIFHAFPDDICANESPEETHESPHISVIVLEWR
jgi:hypothetical protein